jgi:hypothetical protein
MLPYVRAARATPDRRGHNLRERIGIFDVEPIEVFCATPDLAALYVSVTLISSRERRS